MNGEPTPAGADLQQMIARGQLQLPANPVVLGTRRFRQSGIRTFEVRAGIHHRLIKHEPKEFVAKVVMRGDILPASRLRIAIEPVHGPEQGPGQYRKTSFHTVQQLAIEDKNTNQCREIVTAPESPPIGIGDPDRPSQCDIGIGVRIADRDRRL